MFSTLNTDFLLGGGWLLMKNMFLIKEIICLSLLENVPFAIMFAPKLLLYVSIKWGSEVRHSIHLNFQICW